MNAVCFIFEAIIVYSISILSSAKPFIGEDKNFSEDKLRCMDSTESSDYDRSYPNSFTDFYNKPRPRFEGSEKYINRPFDYDKKRSVLDDPYSSDGVSSGSLYKRQVGVVYKDERPIGILQPFQRSYRFIPIKEESLDENQDLTYNIPHVAGVDKREANDISNYDENYASILTNFKIGSKLDKKRNFDAFTDENVHNLKTTIRRLRSSNSQNTEQIEEKLKNILDDMGLIDNDETHAEKREILEDPKEDEDEPLLDDELSSSNERNKRDEVCDSGENTNLSDGSEYKNRQNLLASDARIKSVATNENDDVLVRREDSEKPNPETRRKKRQKQEMSNEGAQLIENLKDSGNLMVSGNKSPLASSSEITARDAESDKISDEKSDEEHDDYEKRVERQIQNKINTLKEEVTREIEDLKQKQSSQEDIQRKKRQVAVNLAEEETDELNPTKNIDQELKPLIRKRRSFEDDRLQANSSKVHFRRKRETNPSFYSQKTKRSSHSSDIRSNEKKYNTHHEDNEEGGELLGDDFEESALSKRETYGKGEDYGDLNREDGEIDEALFERSKRSRSLPALETYDSDLYDGNYLYDVDNGRFKRQNIIHNDGNFQQKRLLPIGSFRLKPRLRRRINEDQAMANRPQQLSDMSDLDLFGALPKSYSGELSRYKRVKRK